MKTQSILLSLIIGAIAAPIAATAPGCGIARAAEIQIPRNQSDFDQFAVLLGNSAPAERRAQLNRAGNAFDNGESRLFWFTDLNAARAQAKRENKPILSLRLLGNLSDELSCANSRLFRVLLYPNAEINRQLRENFVLHWSSERPVPVATIEMGDGRVFKRTLTGNSAHYLLSADGMPLDVLPGLYAPAEFAAWLQRGADFTRDWRATNADLRPKMLSDWHRGRLLDSTKAIVGQFKASEETNFIIATNFLMNGKRAPTRVRADVAQGLLYSKTAMESPIVNAIGQTPDAVLPLVYLSDIRPLSNAFPAGTLFNSRTLTDAQNSKAAIFDAATRARIAAMQPQNDAQTLVSALERNVLRDTQSNRRNFEPAIHAYFVNEAAPEFAKLNRAIYDKLFLTPASDPWLGLAPADAFVALNNGGVSKAQITEQRVAQKP